MQITMIGTLRSRLAAATARTRLTLLLILVVVGSTHCSPMTWNDESRMATIQSIVESHTLVIDQTDFATTGDKVRVKGHFYSDKPPMPAFLGAAIYLPLHMVGLKLREGANASYFFITLFTVGLAWVLGTLAIFESLRFAGLDDDGRFLVAAAIGFGSTFMSWSTTFNNHELAGGSLAIGFFFLLRARIEPKPLDVLWAGLFISLAGACDVPTGIFYVAFLIHVVTRKELRSKWMLFVIPVVLTALPTAAANFSIHQSIMPLQIYRNYFLYPGSPWNESPDLSGIQINATDEVVRYAFLTLIGPMGFLLYNPFLSLAGWYCLRTAWTAARFRSESICVLSGTALLVVYYWSTTSNFGGWSYSIRWFVPLLPLFFFFLFPFFANATRGRRRVFLLVLGVSVVIGLVGALNPWSPLAYSEIPFTANIEQFLQHLMHPGQVYVKPRG